MYHPVYPVTFHERFNAQLSAQVTPV